MDNFLLITITGVLLLYFFSSTNVYKSLYQKINEEKNIVEKENKKLITIIDRYEKQVKITSGAVKENQENLHVAREDLQKIRLENTELKHQVELLESRAEELYAQINTMI